MPHSDEAKSGFKWPIAAARRIAAPAERVWEIISTPGNLEGCHPFCESNPVHEWPGGASRDEVHYLNGRVFERRFQSWLEGVGYDLEIGSPGGRTSFVSWRIAPIRSGTCDLEIVVYPLVLQQVPVAVRWLPHLLYLRPRLESYLSSVVKGVEWFATRNERVPRDQFGRHPWFSASELSGQARSVEPG